jgi:ribosomal protein L11 methyltransferase
MVRNKKRWKEVILKIPCGWEEILPDFLRKKGFSGAWLDEESMPPHRVVLRSYVSQERWASNVEAELRAHLEALSHIFPGDSDQEEMEVRVIEEQDWASQWLPFFQPFKLGPIWIRPSQRTVELGVGDQEIVLDPGQAFGTGHHESTLLCLESMLLLYSCLKSEASVLDMGTGSGILAMFAAKLGFTNILAIDIDPVAVKTALRNITANGLEDYIKVQQDFLRPCGRRFDLILANLSLHHHQELAEEFRLCLKRGGWLVASGFLTGETDTLTACFSTKDLEVSHRKAKNDWECLILRKR